MPAPGGAPARVVEVDYHCRVPRVATEKTTKTKAREPQTKGNNDEASSIFVHSGLEYGELVNLSFVSTDRAWRRKTRPDTRRKMRSRSY